MHAGLAEITRRQFGLVSHSQAREIVTTAQLKHLLAVGRLEPVRRRVYRAAGAPQNWHQHLLAACLARPDAVASFRAAAALWMFPGFEPDVIEITVPGRSHAVLDGVVVHETQVWGDSHHVTKLGIPTTSVARTLCDLTALSRGWVVERAVDDALRRKLLTLRALRRLADELAGPGRCRCTVMRQILDARQPGYHPGDSDPEVRIADLLVASDLPRPIAQHRVRIGRRTVRADLAYPDSMIVIEYDSWGFHSERSAFDADRARGNELEVRGYTVLRFTSRSSDTQIVETVSAALARASVGRGTPERP